MPSGQVVVEQSRSSKDAAGRERGCRCGPEAVGRFIDHPGADLGYSRHEVVQIDSDHPALERKLADYFVIALAAQVGRYRIALGIHADVCDGR